MGRREQALDAALDLLAVSGTRGLTHGAVDRRGGLPPGTTSNHFRSRDALLAGALDHLAVREMDLIRGLEQAAGRGPDVADGSVEAPAAEAAAVLELLLGPGRAHTLARHAIFLEAAWRAELRGPLLAATAPFWELLARRLAAAGAPSPEQAARTLLACIDGLIVDHSLRPQDGFEAVAALTPLIRGLVRR